MKQNHRLMLLALTLAVSAFLTGCATTHQSQTAASQSPIFRNPIDSRGWDLLTVVF